MVSIQKSLISPSAEEQLEVQGRAWSTQESLTSVELWAHRRLKSLEKRHVMDIIEKAEFGRDIPSQQTWICGGFR